MRSWLWGSVSIPWSGRRCYIFPRSRNFSVMCRMLYFSSYSSMSRISWESSPSFVLCIIRYRLTKCSQCLLCVIFMWVGLWLFRMLQAPSEYRNAWICDLPEPWSNRRYLLKIFLRTLGNTWRPEPMIYQEYRLVKPALLLSFVNVPLLHWLLIWSKHTR